MTETTELTVREQRAVFINDWKDWIMGMIPRLQEMHPGKDGLAATTVEMMIGAATASPTLFDCTRQTIWRCVSQAASMGLTPGNEIMGEYYLIPRKHGGMSRKANRDVFTATPMLGYKAYVKMMLRSPHVTAINAFIHYNDERDWELEYGTDPHIRHVPEFPAMDTPEQKALRTSGNVAHAYAVATMVGGGNTFAILSFDELEKVRTQYGSADPKSVWQTNRIAMYRKTALRRLANSVPMEANDPLHQALAMDVKIDRGEPLVATDFNVDMDEPEAPVGVEVEVEEAPR
jgi:phage RecT family recombinase